MKYNEVLKELTIMDLQRNKEFSTYFIGILFLQKSNKYQYLGMITYLYSL